VSIISASTRQAFVRESFPELNEASRRYRIEKSRTSSGLWRLTLFYAAITDEIDSQSNGREREVAFRELEDKTAKWAQEYPDSPAAHIAHSMVLIDHAWAYRGNGYAATVKPQSWAPFRRYIAKARVYLETHKAVVSIHASAHNAKGGGRLSELDKDEDAAGLSYSSPSIASSGMFSCVVLPKRCSTILLRWWALAVSRAVTDALFAACSNGPRVLVAPAWQRLL
jgi:hypothetical protein